MSNRARYIIRIVMACIACLACSAVPGWAAHDSSNPSKNVGQVPVVSMKSTNIFIMNSYHQGYVWSDSILEGIRTVFSQEKKSPELYVEYLDTKRNEVEVAFATMHTLVLEKYSKIHFDVIIAVDDNALTFVEKYRDDLFKNVPVVFCGINDYRNERIEKPWLTGVIEKQDIVGTINLALALDPARNKIYVVSDSTVTSKALLDSLRMAQPLFKGRAEFYDLINLTWPELRERLQNLPRDALVLYLSFYKTRDGRFFTVKESVDHILDASTAPVYVLASQYMKTGVMGGVMLSGKMQGDVAGNMARRILEGESMANLPVVSESPNIVTLDYKALTRFGYSIDQVPENVQVINQPYSLWKEHRVLVVFVMILGAIQFLIIMLLGVNVRRRERAERAVKVARDLMLDIINSMPSVLVNTDSRGIIGAMNTAALSAVGMPEQEARGKSLVTVFPFLARHVEKIEEAIIEGQSLKLQRVNVLVQGLSRYYDIETYPLSAQDDGGSGGGVVRLDDVTDRVQVESMLIQTEKMLSLGGLAAGMAHEINNPLGGILQGAQNIERRISDGLDANHRIAAKVGCSLQCIRDYMEERGIVRLLNGIRESGTRAAEIVAHMLDFSRGEASRRTLVDMAALVDSTLELARSDYDIKKNYDFSQLTCIVDTAPDMPLVPCRSSEIEQVIFNLLKNAAQALFGMGRPMKEGVITVRMHVHDDQAIIEIEDNGPGLDEVSRSRVFDPFFTTKAPREGTGLGLSVAYFIITRNHGGTFTVESELGKGAHFTISLPLTEKDDNRAMQVSL